MFLQIPRLAAMAVKMIFREIYILWRFINNDIIDTVLITVIVFFTGWAYYRRPFYDVWPHLAAAFFYSVLYIYTFCLSNQVAGVEEDRLNKPYRPLVMGLLSVKAARYRTYVYNILYLAYGFYCGIFWYTLGWIVVSLYMNMLGGSNHWATKNLLAISIGTFLLFASQWHFAVPPGTTWSYRVQLYFAILSIWAGFALPLQDLRDVAGDDLKGRKTLPVSLGMFRARKLLCIHFLVVLPAIFLLGMLTLKSFTEILRVPLYLSILLAGIIWHWVVAYRVMKFTNTAAEAHETYTWYVLLFCAAIPLICFMR